MLVYFIKILVRRITFEIFVLWYNFVSISSKCESANMRGNKILYFFKHSTTLLILKDMYFEDKEAKINIFIEF